MASNYISEVDDAPIIDINETAVRLGHQHHAVVLRLGWRDRMEGPRHAGIAMIGNSHKRAKKVARANINPAAAPNTYTGKAGSKRD